MVTVVTLHPEKIQNTVFKQRNEKIFFEFPAVEHFPRHEKILVSLVTAKSKHGQLSKHKILILCHIPFTALTVLQQFPDFALPTCIHFGSFPFLSAFENLCEDCTREKWVNMRYIPTRVTCLRFLKLIKASVLFTTQTFYGKKVRLMGMTNIENWSYFQRKIL